MTNPTEDTWETGEVILYLINDEFTWNKLKNKKERIIRAFVLENWEGSEIAASFRNEKGKKRLINWTSVAQSLQEKEEVK